MYFVLVSCTSVVHRDRFCAFKENRLGLLVRVPPIFAVK